LPTTPCSIFCPYTTLFRSSSHTLIGGFIGAAIANAGGFSGMVNENGEDVIIDVIVYSKVLPIIAFIFLAPLLGMILAYFITVSIDRKSTCLYSIHVKISYV